MLGSSFQMSIFGSYVQPLHSSEIDEEEVVDHSLYPDTLIHKNRMYKNTC